MYVYRTKTRLGRLIFRYANIRNQRCKKRVLEFVMNLDTLNNEKKKEELKTKETKIKKDWEKVVNDIVTACFKENCDVIGVPMKPSALTEIDLNGIQI